MSDKDLELDGFILEYADCISVYGLDPHPKKCPEYGIISSAGEALILKFLGSVEYPFIGITPWYILTLRGSTCWGAIYGSNRTV